MNSTQFFSFLSDDHWLNSDEGAKMRRAQVVKTLVLAAVVTTVCTYNTHLNLNLKPYYKHARICQCKLDRTTVGVADNTQRRIRYHCKYDHSRN